MLLLVFLLLVSSSIGGSQPLLGCHHGRGGRGSAGRGRGGGGGDCFLAHGGAGTGRFTTEVSELEEDISRRGSTGSIFRVVTPMSVTVSTIATTILDPNDRRRRRLSRHTHRRRCRCW